MRGYGSSLTFRSARVQSSLVTVSDALQMYIGCPDVLNSKCTQFSSGRSVLLRKSFLSWLWIVERVRGNHLRTDSILGQTLKLSRRLSGLNRKSHRPPGADTSDATREAIISHTLKEASAIASHPIFTA